MNITFPYNPIFPIFIPPIPLGPPPAAIPGNPIPIGYYPPKGEGPIPPIGALGLAPPAPALPPVGLAPAPVVAAGYCADELAPFPLTK